MVASNRLSGSHDDHAVPIPDSKERVLRAAVLYGANGAGKSNLFKALRYVKWVALYPRGKDEGTGRDAFRFGEPGGGASSFDLQFVAAEKLYRFGFKVDDERITAEWLFQVVGNRQRAIYERSTDRNGKVAVDVGGLKEAGERVKALATVGGPQNQSFLATAYAILDAGDLVGELGEVISWFAVGLALVGPGMAYRGLGHRLDEDVDFLQFAGAYLRSASTGVDRLEVLKEEVSKEDLADSVVSRALRNLGEHESGTARLSLSEGKDLVVERKGGEHFYRVSVHSVHAHEPGKAVRMELTEESDGTRRLLNLVPALYDLQATGKVHVIDEIDRSLHPMLVKEFLESFLKVGDGQHGQIIFTTHETTLLDQELLRRDEIWFAEKDQTAATRLYSLLDFKVRNDRDIRKGYLLGRFGAIPFLGGVEPLLPKTEHVE